MSLSVQTSFGGSPSCGQFHIYRRVQFLEMYRSVSRDSDSQHDSVFNHPHTLQAGYFPWVGKHTTRQSPFVRRILRIPFRRHVCWTNVFQYRHGPLSPVEYRFFPSLPLSHTDRHHANPRDCPHPNKRIYSPMSTHLVAIASLESPSSSASGFKSSMRSAYRRRK